MKQSKMVRITGLIALTVIIGSLGIIGLIFTTTRGGNNAPQQEIIAMNCYLYIEGIPGGSTEAGHEGWIEVISFSHGLYYPYESPTTRSDTHVHNSITITKSFDKSSPMLYQTLANGQVISSVNITWFSIEEGAGTENKYFTIVLEDAIITSVQAYDPPVADVLPIEEVSFNYHHISWIYEEEGITSADDWPVPT
jgi:type VI secretion system secreted protein Hcp